MCRNDLHVLKCSNFLSLDTVPDLSACQYDERVEEADECCIGVTAKDQLHNIIDGHLGPM